MGRLLVHVTHGPEAPTRAALGLLVAKAAIDEGHDVDVFLAGDAVQLVRDAVLDALTGLGTPNQMREYVEDGTVEAFALWNPEDLGYLATPAANALVAGDISGEAGDTFEAGELGEFEVGADGVVLLGEPFTFDADNISDFDF